LGVNQTQLRGIGEETMNPFEKTAFTIASLIAFCHLGHAGDSITPNPYAMIAARNVFNLNPIIEDPVIFSAPVEPLPKLQPDGIITVFGRPQVLFKIVELQHPSGAKARESSHFMAEGEREDDVEVIHIDSTTGTVIFKNHGVVQQMTLTDSPAGPSKTTVSPAPAK
jgi:hypothetical protein